MNWLPHRHSARRAISECGHYERTVNHGVAGDVYDAWYHIGQPDFEHVGYSKDPELLDRLVEAHAKHKHVPLSPTPPEESA